MNRLELEKNIEMLINKNEKHLNENEKIEIIKNAISNMGDGTGNLNLLIVIEEFGELIEEIIYFLKTNKIGIGLKEELIDNIIGIKFVEVLLFNNINIDKEYEKFKKDNNNVLNFNNLILNASVLQQLISKFLREKTVRDSFQINLFKIKYDLEKLYEFIKNNDYNNKKLDYLEYLEDLKYLRQKERNLKNIKK